MALFRCSAEGEGLVHVHILKVIARLFDAAGEKCSGTRVVETFDAFAAGTIVVRAMEPTELDGERDMTAVEVGDDAG